MSSSRLSVDSLGRAVVIVTTSTDPRTPAGTIFLVVDQCTIFEPRGRAPTPDETLRTRAPFNAPAPLMSTNMDVPDEELDDAEAIRQAMLEQRRQPVDLLSRVAV
jgi:hypothetical protein